MKHRFPGVVVTKFLAALSLVAASVALAAFSPAAHAQSVGDAQRGAKLAYTCLGCHGIPNYKNAYPTYSVPKLRGQHPEYLVIALQAYRSGERSHATMHANAASWTDQQYADMAAFLAGPVIAPPAAPKPVGKLPAVGQTCVACHGADGIGITPQYPTLAGQHADYLERALTDYKKGGRKNAIMAGFAGQLSAQDIRDMARYYSSQRPGLDTAKRPVR
ncbi:MAG: cytochrome c [Gammaproteobacteria bacterium]|nr:cytochrome c [Gammaproteobacteria bacterium]